MRSFHGVHSLALLDLSFLAPPMLALVLGVVTLRTSGARASAYASGGDALGS
eukprot:CAMPEP_0117612012 /NCGR_PEP_ID=MMETSP0784-20121206/82714_1 /TAXON_ID=39447 /ORGANISM="" /LENGTH=51 /DNA_ID=CAMNT_0005415523 /DNA_START=84 /DNA_END=236 /DNA_ORIENTATION=+